MRISDWSSDVCSSDLDPITNGHMDIITRAATHMVDQLIIAVARNAGKGPLFGVEDRVQMVLDEVAALPPAAKASDRKSVVEGKSVSVRVDLGGRRIIKKQNKIKKEIAETVYN